MFRKKYKHKKIVPPKKKPGKQEKPVNTTDENGKKVLKVPIEANEHIVVHKNYTSWVTVFLLFVFTGLACAGLWFYMKFMYVTPEITVSTAGVAKVVEVAPEYEPKDVRATKFEHHQKDFDIEDLKAQSYIYSRDHVMYISLMSGAGNGNAFPDTDLQKIAEQVDLLKSVDISKGFRFIKDLFFVTNSTYVIKPTYDNFGTLELKKTQQKYDVSDEALGWLILLETEWGKHLQYEKVYGAPAEKENALYRVLGSIMILSARSQALSWIKEDHYTTPTGEYILATAFLNLSQTLKSDKIVGTNYENPLLVLESSGTSGDQLEKSAKRLFLNAGIPQDVRGMAIASTMMGLYGNLETGAHDEIKKRLAQFDQRLSYNDFPTVADKAWGVVTYIEIGKRLNDPSIIDKGWALYEQKLKKLFMPDKGMFYQQDLYSPMEVAAVLQMLNRINEVGGQYFVQGEVEEFKLKVFESLVNQSKLQRSHFPEEYFPIPKNLFSAEWSFYDTVPGSDVAGGEYGKPPITGHRTWNKEGRWMLYDDRYVPEEGLYFAYVMMTLSSDYFVDVKSWSSNKTK